jgi:hypothetical protein
LTAYLRLEGHMNIELLSIDILHRNGDNATHPLARPDGRLAVSLLLAGMSLRRRRFVPDTRLNAPSGAFNYGS